jgi:hypothetical protein
MKTAIENITTLFLDIGGVLLTFRKSNFLKQIIKICNGEKTL